MADTLELGDRKLQLDGEWGLLDFSAFGRQYVQSYSFLYALTLEEENEEDTDERVEHAFMAYPWRGGWSTVDFYESLRARVPKRHRPKIVRIEYASPGFIELALVLSVAYMIRKIVKHICDSLNDVNNTYNNIHKGMRDRKLTQISVRRAEVRLSKEELEFVQQSADMLADKIGFTQMDTVRELTPNQLVALKVLLSFYRRARHLANLQNKGQIRF
jgi:hypothetical protein